jgi:hypothetical protein
MKSPCPWRTTAVGREQCRPGTTIGLADQALVERENLTGPGGDIGACACFGVAQFVLTREDFPFEPPRARARRGIIIVFGS